MGEVSIRIGADYKTEITMFLQVKDIVQRSIKIKQQILQDEGLLKTIEEVAEVCTSALRQDKKILFCGNGGSASDAQHLAAELSGRFYLERKPLFAEALHVNTSYLTAVANDYSFVHVYARLIQAKARRGDVLIAISTSGNSKNIINAIHQAKSQGVITIGMTGQSGGEMKDLVDYLMCVPSTDTPRIQEAHILIGHIYCEIIERNMAEDNS